MTLKKDTDNVARTDLEELGTNKGSEIGGKGDSRIICKESIIQLVAYAHSNRGRLSCGGG